jgi:hypothetical protein
MLRPFPGNTPTGEAGIQYALRERYVLAAVNKKAGAGHLVINDIYKAKMPVSQKLTGISFLAMNVIVCAFSGLLVNVIKIKMSI